MNHETIRQALEMGLSWARVFVAAALAQYAAGITDPSLLLNAGVVGLLPVVLRWLDPMDKAYGRGANE